MKMNPMTIMSGTYDYRLVALSIVLAMLASYAALDLSGRVSSTRGWARVSWLIAGAGAMGVGIWSMHYVGMLALSMSTPVYYHVPTVAASLAAAIFASAAALFVVSRPQMGVRQELLGSLVMGFGIVSMHYLGMAAMRCAAEVVYNWKRVALSIVLAVAGSLLALVFAFRLRAEESVSWQKVIGALLMGGAIPLTHYAGMWAATFRPSNLAVDLAHAIGTSSLGIVSVSASSGFILGGAIVSSFFDRLIALQKGNLHTSRERELYFQTMAEAVPEIIWTADPQGQ